MRGSFAVVFCLGVVLVGCAEARDDAGEVVDGDTAVVGEAGGAPASDDASVGGDSIDASDPSGSAGDPDNVATIPERFHGEWNGDLVACGTGSSETRLRISADQIRFYESVGVVRNVEVESDRVVVVDAEYTGEGETWSDRRRLMLAGDGESLTVGGTNLVRHRCP